MRAIDLYSGVGGWSLGLKLAGVQIAASYEFWLPALRSQNLNLGEKHQPTDIRKLSLADIPSDIDLVVGSPPCTTFSYSNRGGSGNTAEGLIDVVKFLEVVEAVNPKYWALENVPRVRNFLEAGFRDRSSPLFRFREMVPNIEVVDFSDFGVPQSRKRCIAGNFPNELLQSYSDALPNRTLGQVTSALSAKSVCIDPVWGFKLKRAQVTEMDFESELDEEEMRMNRDAKAHHPVYNGMNFPDRLDLPSRTITATCSKVSRESIVIPGVRGFRRLNLRERAAVQGFPINYQFFGTSFSEKAKMIGNAIPPYFTFLFAQAVQGVAVEELEIKQTNPSALSLTPTKPKATLPKRQNTHFSKNRGFRAVIPGLRFKSGMRFDLSNLADDRTAWKVSFFYGPSTNIQSVPLDDALLALIGKSAITKRIELSLGVHFLRTEQDLQRTSPKELQSVWSKRETGMSPFDLVDSLGGAAQEVFGMLDRASPDDQHAAAGYVLEAATNSMTGSEILGAKKLSDNALRVFAGMYVGAWFNTLRWHNEAYELADTA